MQTLKNYLWLLCSALVFVLIQAFLASQLPNITVIATEHSIPKDSPSVQPDPEPPELDVTLLHWGDLINDEEELVLRENPMAEITEEEPVEITSEMDSAVAELFRSGFLPVDKELLRITSPYGMREHPITGAYQMHTGIDISKSKDNISLINGKPAYAALGGVVKSVEHSDSGYGNMIIIDHRVCQTRYAHLGEITVAEKEDVEAGQKVGTVGSTGLSNGPHLHFELHINDTHVDPVPYLRLLQPDISAPEPGPAPPEEPTQEESASEEPTQEEPVPQEPDLSVESILESIRQLD